MAEEDEDEEDEERNADIENKNPTHWGKISCAKHFRIVIHLV